MTVMIRAKAFFVEGGWKAQAQLGDSELPEWVIDAVKCDQPFETPGEALADAAMRLRKVVEKEANIEN